MSTRRRSPITIKPDAQYGAVLHSTDNLNQHLTWLGVWSM
jgi:hypothetical protein